VHPGTKYDKRSAQTLSQREGDVVSGLLKLLAGSDRNARYGAKAFDKCIANIEASKESPTLVSLKDFIAKASAGGDASKSNNTKKGTQ
jgi:hypothetical protein